jgi:hypothetical protein
MAEESVQILQPSYPEPSAAQNVLELDQLWLYAEGIADEAIRPACHPSSSSCCLLDLMIYVRQNISRICLLDLI